MVPAERGEGLKNRTGWLNAFWQVAGRGEICWKFIVMRLFYLLILWVLLLLTGRVVAQNEADTVRPGKGPLRAGALKPGLRQYLLCYQDPKNDRQLRFWYWLRDISVEHREGKEVYVITQHWYGSDSGSYRRVYSVNDAGDFAPLYHRELVRGKLNAYDWRGDGVAGSDSVEGNVRKGFRLPFNEPNYNWNLDIETFELLPLAEGKVFLINFYDAGYDVPKYVRYSVAGSERIRMLDGQEADCWVLRTEGTEKGSDYKETYWISKKEHKGRRPF